MDVAISFWPFFMKYGYAILIVGIALDNVGLPLPGEVSSSSPQGCWPPRDPSTFSQ